MTLQLHDKSLLLREINENDREALCRIYSSTRKEELDQMTYWSEDQKKAFLNFQFNAQHTYYKQHYPTAAFWIIEKEGKAIGRLYLDVHFDRKSIRIIDISILPEWRNRGIGQQILLDIIALAKKIHRRVSIHVESFNPAMNLYKRLGFELVDITNGVYHLLEWKNRQAIFQS